MELEVGKQYRGKFRIWKQKTEFDGMVEYNAKKEVLLTLFLSMQAMRPEPNSSNFMLDTTYISGVLENGSVVHCYNLHPLSTKQNEASKLDDVVVTVSLIIKNMVVAPDISADTLFSSIICLYSTEQTWEQLREDIIDMAKNKLTTNEPAMLKMRLFKYFVTISPLPTQSSPATIKIELNTLNMVNMDYLHDARDTVLQYLSPVISKLTLEEQRITQLADVYELFSTGY